MNRETVSGQAVSVSDQETAEAVMSDQELSDQNDRKKAVAAVSDWNMRQPMVVMHLLLFGGSALLAVLLTCEIELACHVNRETYQYAVRPNAAEKRLEKLTIR